MPPTKSATAAAKASAPKAKPSAALKPLLKVLTKHEGAMPLVELLSKTLLKGLKKIDPKVVAKLRTEIEADTRFVLVGDAEDQVDLASRMPAAADTPAGHDPVPDEGEMTQNHENVRSLGEMLDAATAKPCEIAKPISPTVGNARIGDRLVHDVHGPGKVVARTDISLTILFDGGGEPKLLDLRFATNALRFEDPSTVISAAAAPAPSIPEAAQTISEEERQSRFHSAMVAHAEKGKELSIVYAQEKQTETQQQAEINETHKRLKDLVKRMVEHNSNVPTIELISQRTIGFDVGPAPATSTAPPATPEGFHPLPPEQTISLKDADLTMAEMHQKLFEELKPGKSPKVKDFAVQVRGVVGLLRQHSPDRTRWFLQQLVDMDAYEQTYAEKYGRVVSDGDANAESRNARKLGGEDCGRTVKIGKKTLVLAPEDHGLVIVASKEAVDSYLRAIAPAPEPVGKERAAGE